MMKPAAYLICLFLAAAFFHQTARADLVASLHEGRLKVIDAKGQIVFSTNKVLNFKEGHALVGFIKEEKQDGASFNLVSAVGKLVYKSRDVKEYYIDDAIVAVIERSGKLKVIRPDGSVCFSDKDGVDQLGLSVDFIAYLKGDRLKVVLNTGEQPLSVKGVKSFRLTRNLAVFRKEKARVIATRKGAIVFRETTE